MPAGQADGRWWHFTSTHPPFPLDHQYAHCWWHFQNLIWTSEQLGKLSYAGWRTAVWQCWKDWCPHAWRGTWPCSCLSQDWHWRCQTSPTAMGDFICNGASKRHLDAFDLPPITWGWDFVVQGRASWDCVWLTGCFRVGNKRKMGKERDQDISGRNKHEKYKE